MDRIGSEVATAVVGDNTIDRYLGGSPAQYVGGNAVNVAVQLARRGGQVTYFGAIGTDADGDTIEKALAHTTVNLSGLVRHEGNSATTEIRSTQTGDRVFEKEDFGVTQDYYPEDEVIARIANADWVHIGMLPRAAEMVDRLTRLAPTIQISQDCSVSSGYSALAVAFASAGENHDAAVELALAAVRGGARLAVITKGASGSIAYDGKHWWQQDAVSTKVVDTTGAGDSFIAGFIHATVNDESVPTALLTGSRWAAATCEHRAGFPQ